MKQARLRRSLLGGAYGLYTIVRWRLLRAVTLGVRILLVQDGCVLLIRHSYQRGWNFPGGGIKVGETVAEAASREAAEEAGALVRDEPWLLGVYTNFAAGKSDHIAVVVSESWSVTEPTDRWEIEARVLYSIDALPQDLPRSVRDRIEEYARLRDAGHPPPPALKRWQEQ